MTPSEIPEPRVLVILAHPDDPEFYCGGTIARWAAEGRAITYCLATSGGKGADEPGEDPRALALRREAEQRAAAAVLGVRQVLFLGRPDGELSPDLELRRDLCRVIRRVRPDTLISCDPTTIFPRGRRINHGDHRAVGWAALDAVYPASGSALYFPELLQEGLAPFKVRQVFLAGSQDPNTTVDITDHIERKLDALRCHASQLSDAEELLEQVRRRLLDPDSSPEAPRYIEQFRLLEPFD